MPRPQLQPRQRIGLILFAVCLFSYANLRQGDFNHNVISRIALTYSILDGTGLAIDHYHRRTEDKAFHDGHYYSDKAPGLALSALPAVWLGMRAFQLRWQTDSLSELTMPDTFGGHHQILCYLATLSTCGLATALAALVIYGLALRSPADTGAALFAGISYGLGSIAFGYSLLFMGHAVAGAMLLGAFAAFWWIDHGEPGPGDPWIGALGGALLGWTVVTEYASGPVALAIACLALWRSLSWPRERRLRVLGAACVAGAASLAPLPWYNWLAFGSPFELSYSKLVGWEGMQTGFFGIGPPSLDALFHITVSPYRGLFFFSPILLASLPGLVRMARAPRERPYALLIAIAFLYYLLMNSGFRYWEGGWATGPRHLVPAIGLLCVPIAHLWATSGPGARKGLVVLLALSAALALVGAATHMAADERLRNPLFEALLPRLASDRVSTIYRPLGIHGPAGLIPLFIGWGVAAYLVRREWSRLETHPDRATRRTPGTC